MSDLILGAGMTGLSAGVASGLPVYEANGSAGGVCSSYYVRPGENQRLMFAPEDGEAYRFEIGGGHWIFGGDPTVLRFIRSHVTLKSYERRSSVYFQNQKIYVPYPLQNHLRFLPAETAIQSLSEMAKQAHSFKTMKEWLIQSFGPTLCELFFNPFHELYTAGLYDKIAPQDAYKSPVDLSLAIRGAFNEAPPVGYNATFVYPAEDLNTFARKMAARCDVHYEKQVERIDTEDKIVYFADGTTISYNHLISTLPLNTVMEMTGFEGEHPPDPFSSVLVLNIGAVRGKQCPDDHWLYNTHTASGFHRVGFYSNVDAAFMPMSARDKKDRVSIYVERAFTGSAKPSADETSRYSNGVVRELQDWGFIEDVEVADPTWIDVAYTWRRTDSDWKQQALRKLETGGIYQVGRYARWSFHGIADSVRDGLMVGASFKK